jgi:hypothetical protein
LVGLTRLTVVDLCVFELQQSGMCVHRWVHARICRDAFECVWEEGREMISWGV